MGTDLYLTTLLLCRSATSFPGGTPWCVWSPQCSSQKSWILGLPVVIVFSSCCGHRAVVQDTDHVTATVFTDPVGEVLFHPLRVMEPSHAARTQPSHSTRGSLVPVHGCRLLQSSRHSRYKTLRRDRETQAFGATGVCISWGRAPKLQGRQGGVCVCSSVRKLIKGTGEKGTAPAFPLGCPRVLHSPGFPVMMANLE